MLTNFGCQELRAKKARRAISISTIVKFNIIIIDYYCYYY